MSVTLQADSVAELLQQTLASVLPGAVFPHEYTGGLLTYITWNYNTAPAVWAESKPHAARYLIQVHYYLPHKSDPRGTILGLQHALSNADFTWPSITEAHDDAGQHWVLECEYTDGGGLYGYA